jgi:hypothetical protein
MCVCVDICIARLRAQDVNQTYQEHKLQKQMGTADVDHVFIPPACLSTESGLVFGSVFLTQSSDYTSREAEAAWCDPEAAACLS